MMKFKPRKKNIPKYYTLNECIIFYERLIYKIAQRYVRDRVELEDLVQEGKIGLILAYEKFDPLRSEDFHTFAIFYIKGKMYEYCMRNESPVYIPIPIAKASFYVKKIKSIVEKEKIVDSINEVEDIVLNEVHPAEELLTSAAQEEVKETKRKLGRIAYNSKVKYKTLALHALCSISPVISDDVLFEMEEPKGFVDETVSNEELSQHLKDSLGEKRFVVLSMSAQGWTHREIANKLSELGYNNKDGKAISRQAVKNIIDETLRALRKGILFSREPLW